MSRCDDLLKRLTDALNEVRCCLWGAGLSSRTIEANHTLSMSWTRQTALYPNWTGMALDPDPTEMTLGFD